MKILALEPYFGGSHKAFLEGWRSHSQHEFTTLKLPPYKWKWRMRHAAITFARQVRQRAQLGASWDVIWASDMLNLAEFIGLSDAQVARLPRVAYFHENQLTYPTRQSNERDYHFAFTNITTALSADQVWFNSQFHADDFLRQMPRFLQRMPDFQPVDVAGLIRAKTTVQSPGITLDSAVDGTQERPAGPLRIVWAARWEHDKNPQLFFRAIDSLARSPVPFRLSVLGESFEQAPPEFALARERLHGHIDQWGYVKSRAEYQAALQAADVFVSTADHEFFGISVVEAIRAGAYPVLPNRLSYPELIQLKSDQGMHEFLFDGSVEDLATRLRQLAARLERTGSITSASLDRLRSRIRRFDWSQRAPALDRALSSAARS